VTDVTLQEIASYVLKNSWQPEQLLYEVLDQVLVGLRGAIKKPRRVGAPGRLVTPPRDR